MLAYYVHAWSLSPSLQRKFRRALVRLAYVAAFVGSPLSGNCRGSAIRHPLDKVSDFIIRARSLVCFSAAVSAILFTICTISCGIR